MMKIEIAVDHAEAEIFVEFLRQRGFDAAIGQTIGNYVNGRWTGDSPELAYVFEQLWREYCYAAPPVP